ncbi:MAG: YbjQ family protein [Planctomycetes bacterium]|nr:YbjQ family protein [Planctomycetota bacterium]
MIVVTTPDLPGRRVVKVLGLCYGNAVRSRHAGKSLLAALKSLAGGEVEEYTAMLAQTREQALDRMIENARSMGANAILAAHFATSEMLSNTAELIVYGTAVVVEPAP